MVHKARLTHGHTRPSDNMKQLYGKDRKGVTLIELVTTILIISIISAVTAGIVISLMQLFVYLPREMKARNIAHEVMDIMGEGETQRRGMRYAVEVQEALPTRFIYTFGYPGNTDKRIMRFRWDNASKKIYRSYTAFGSDLATLPQPPYGPEELIPYYASDEISINGRPANPNTIFTYFKADGSAWLDEVDPLNRIRRVEITIGVITGTGLFSTWDSSFQTTSSVEIKQYI